MTIAAPKPLVSCRGSRAPSFFLRGHWRSGGSRVPTHDLAELVGQVFGDVGALEKEQGEASIRYAREAVFPLAAFLLIGDDDVRSERIPVLAAFARLDLLDVVDDAD